MTTYKSEASKRWFAEMRLKFDTDDDGVRAIFKKYNGMATGPRWFAMNKEAAKKAGAKGAKSRWAAHKKKETL